MVVSATAMSTTTTAELPTILELMAINPFHS
jgi:hypothetical protein